ncbi:hypothetical protein I553_8089 [Mycobacterium xenopi 4042]|uniref:Uncharacterized protein n=1 Tax=Mycobacterium xenopi 4042 TaxID=1299334 RepID=X8DC47_MYCXE|nr:hypothetical protein I553_8089 [Mycobacterium xenopi 4042]
MLFTLGLVLFLLGLLTGFAVPALKNPRLFGKGKVRQFSLGVSRGVHRGRRRHRHHRALTIPRSVRTVA